MPYSKGECKSATAERRKSLQQLSQQNGMIMKKGAQNQASRPGIKSVARTQRIQKSAQQTHQPVPLTLWPAFCFGWTQIHQAQPQMTLHARGTVLSIWRVGRK